MTPSPAAAGCQASTGAEAREVAPDPRRALPPWRPGASIDPGRCDVRYYDISLNLSTDTVRWGVAPPLEVHERRRMSRGDDANASALTVSVHAGTHVDAPFHFVPDGAGIDSVPLERFIGPALVRSEERRVGKGLGSVVRRWGHRSGWAI